MAIDLVFEKQTQDDLVAAYALLSSRTQELIEKGTGQYLAPYPPLEQYARRTDLGQNWLVRHTNAPERQILGIVSLIPKGGADDWANQSFPDQYFWISSLFVSPLCKHQNLGPAILEKVKLEARSNSVESIWLDCYLDSGFLEDYYTRHGLRTVETKTFTYGERSFRAALMCLQVESGTRSG